MTTQPDPEAIATEELARELAEITGWSIEQNEFDDSWDVSCNCDDEDSVPFGDFVVGEPHGSEQYGCHLHISELPPPMARALARAVRAVLDDRDPVGDVRLLLALAPSYMTRNIAAYYEEGAP